MSLETLDPAGAGQPPLPLDGIRVVDMSTSYAGPTASMYLADLGADVVKVERPTGDDARGWGPPFVGASSAWFAAANRNKRSIAIDLRTASGAEVLRRLVGSADVFLHNVNPSKLEGLGVDPATVCARSPRLVYCAVSGFGLTGRDRRLPGYDLIAQARSGLMSVTGAAGGVPQRVSAPLSDIVAGLSAALSIIAALHRVSRGGPGGVVDISLLDADLALMAPRIASYLAGEPEPAPSGATDSVLAVYQQFQALDRPVCIAVGNDAIWSRLCGVLELPDLAADPRLASNEGRRRHRPEVIGRIADAVARRDSAHWLAAFAEAGVPAAPIASLSEVVWDPHVRDRASIFALPVAEGDPVAAGDEVTHVVAAPWRISQAEAPRRPAPALGADSRAVLAEIGVDAAGVQALLESGAVLEAAGGGPVAAEAAG
ncbi:CaiB/BaiF CoA transferase family protein [Blastococcus sp. SYSU D00669]